MCRWHWGQILFPWHLLPYLQSLVEIESAWWRYFFVLAVRFEQMKLEPADVSWEVVNELSARVDRCEARWGASEVSTGWWVDCPEKQLVLTSQVPQPTCFSQSQAGTLSSINGSRSFVKAFFFTCYCLSTSWCLPLHCSSSCRLPSSP